MEITKIDGLIHIARGQRFPTDFMFELTSMEAAALRCQIGSSERGHAIKVNIEIMRAFVRLRQVLASNKDLTGIRPSDPCGPTGGRL